MTLDEYQKQAKQTALYGQTLADKVKPIYLYPTLGLAGEAGEIVEKVKKLVRNDDGKISEEFRADIKKELGDVLWYVAQLATEFDVSLEEIAKLNGEKLRSRMERGKLHASGDNR